MQYIDVSVADFAVNSLAPGRSGWDPNNGIYSLVLLIGILRSHDNALWWMPHDLTDDKSTLVQVMAWCRQATSTIIQYNKSLPEPKLTQFLVTLWCHNELIVPGQRSSFCGQHIFWIYIQWLKDMFYKAHKICQYIQVMVLNKFSMIKGHYLKQPGRFVRYGTTSRIKAWHSCNTAAHVALATD